MPVFGDRNEGAHLIGIRPLRTQEMDERLGKRINYYRTLGSRILPNLRGEIEQRRNHANRGTQLRDRTDRFQVHASGLARTTRARESEGDVDLVFCSGGLRPPKLVTRHLSLVTISATAVRYLPARRRAPRPRPNFPPILSAQSCRACPPQCGDS